MKLLIDIGNTRIKWAYVTDGELFDAGEFVHRGKTSTDILKFADQLQNTPQSAAATNVAGSGLGELIAGELNNRFSISMQTVRTTATAGEVRNGYSSTEQLGADRWAALVGGWNLYRSAVCIVDAGSALTIDLVAADGQHYGGIIVPGIAMLQSSLLSDTSDIAGFFERSKHVFREAQWYGRDTATAVERGSIFAALHVIRGALAEFPASGEAPQLVLTGGDAPLLLECSDLRADYRPLLVLEGIHQLSEQID